MKEGRPPTRKTLENSPLVEMDQSKSSNFNKRMRTFSAKPKLIKRTIDELKVENTESKPPKPSHDFDFDETIKFSSIQGEIEKKMVNTISRIQEDPTFKPTVEPNYPKLQKKPKSVILTKQQNVFDFSQSPTRCDNSPDSQKDVDTSFFDDHSLEDPFRIESIREGHMEDPSRGIERIILESSQKPIMRKTTKSTVEIHKSGQIQNKRENIAYALDGLTHKDMDVVEKSLSDFATFCKEESDFFLLLRAYDMMCPTFEALFGLLKNTVLNRVSLHLILLLCKEEQNCNFLTILHVETLSGYLNHSLDDFTTNLLLDSLVNIKKSKKHSFMEINTLIEDYILKTVDTITNKDLHQLCILSSELSLNILSNLLCQHFRFNEDTILLILRHMTNGTHRKHGNVSLSKQTLELLIQLFVLHSFDIQMMILGILINICEKSEEIRREIVSIKVNDVSFLDLTMQKFRVMFQVKFKNEENLLTAYIAILLGCFSQDMPQRNQIQSELGGFDSILNCIQEFIQFQANLGVLTTETKQSLTKLMQRLL
jgi:hypothetical protein